MARRRRPVPIAYGRVRSRRNGPRIAGKTLSSSRTWSRYRHPSLPPASRPTSALRKPRPNSRRNRRSDRARGGPLLPAGTAPEAQISGPHRVVGRLHQRRGHVDRREDDQRDHGEPRGHAGAVFAPPVPRHVPVAAAGRAHRRRGRTGRRRRRAARVLRADDDGAGTGGIGHYCHPGVDTSMLVQMKLEGQKSVRPLGNRQRPFGRAAW